MNSFKQTWIRWFLYGVVAVAAITGASWLYNDALAAPLQFLGALITLGIMVFTNFGRGIWTKAGWSDTQQAPWDIAPIERPRLGGFSTGCFIAIIIALGIEVHMLG